MHSNLTQAVIALLAIALLSTYFHSVCSQSGPHHDGDGDGDGTGSEPQAASSPPPADHHDDSDYSDVVLPSPISSGSSSDNVPPSDFMRLFENPQRLQTSISSEQLQVVYLHPSAASTRATATATATPTGFSVTNPPLVLTCQSGVPVNPATADALLASLSPCPHLPLSQWQSMTGSRSMPVGAALQASGVRAASLPAIGADRYPDGGNQIGRLVLDLSAANADASCPTEYDEARSTRAMPSHCHRQYEAIASLYTHLSPPYLSLPEWPVTPTMQEATRRGLIETGEEWEGRVFELADMFVDRWGRVFNATHFFHAGRCSDNSNKVGAVRGGAMRLLRRAQHRQEHCADEAAARGTQSWRTVVPVSR